MTSTTSYKIRPLWHNFSYFAHQLEGIQWMLEKEHQGTLVPNRDGTMKTTVRGGLQCDDMGLGKTIQITSVMINHSLPQTLLIAPLAMIQTWVEVCERAYMAVYQVQDKKWIQTSSLDAPLPRHFGSFRPAIYITNYEKLYTQPSLFKTQWDRVVLDEAHKIRNGDGQVASYARKIVAPIRWAVTGTPLVNSFKDVVSLLAFLGVPYSPLWRWEPRYIPLLPQLVIHRSLNALRNVIQKAPPIPIIHDLVLPFDTQAEEDFYYGVQGTSQADARKFANDVLSSKDAFKLILRLRQISVHPQVYINAKRRETPSYRRSNWLMPSTKMETIRSILTNDDTSKVHKYIIFCQFNDEMTLLHDFLVYQNLVDQDHVLLYNGSMTQDQRTAVLQRSKETTQTTVMLLQLQAGGVGLNLQEYDRIIFVSPWWTSSLMDQAIARAVRMGQTEVVQVYHLRLDAEDGDSISIDNLVHAKAEEKRRMLEKLFDMCNEHNNNNCDDDSDDE
jgi:SNF2 family DNA or RNA helicase